MCMIPKSHAVEIGLPASFLCDDASSFPRRPFGVGFLSKEPHPHRTNELNPHCEEDTDRAPQNSEELSSSTRHVNTSIPTYEVQFSLDSQSA